jgi:hypothetical protein
MKAIEVMAQTAKAIGKSAMITFLLLMAVIVLQIEKCQSDKLRDETAEINRKLSLKKMDFAVEDILVNQKRIMVNQDSIIMRQKIILDRVCK